MVLILPDEAKTLPPPGIVNRNSLWCGALGWGVAMFQNGVNNRPPFKSGIHRQALFATIGWCIGYYLTKVENYTYAKRDHEMFGYIKLHPEAFEQKEKKTLAEIVEPFHPVR